MTVALHLQDCRHGASATDRRERHQPSLNVLQAFAPEKSAAMRISPRPRPNGSAVSPLFLRVVVPLDAAQVMRLAVAERRPPMHPRKSSSRSVDLRVGTIRGRGRTAHLERVARRRRVLGVPPSGARSPCESPHMCRMPDLPAVESGVAVLPRRSPLVTPMAATMRHPLSALLFASLVTVAAGQSAAPLPNHAGSLKLAVIGDNGTGKQPQLDVAAQMALRPPVVSVRAGADDGRQLLRRSGSG